MENRQREWGASEWLVALLDGPGDQALEAEFSDWLAMDERHPSEWADAVSTYREMGMVSPRFVSPHSGTEDDGQAGVSGADVVRMTSSVASRSRQGFRLGRRAVVAVTALAACVVALLMAPDLLLGLRADFTTGTAELRKIELADGSIVRLAPESAITVDLSGAERRLELLRGIAFLEVAPDTRHPFLAGMEIAEARVVGTAFELAEVRGKDVVTVREGHVRVAPKAFSDPSLADLHAGDRATVSADGSMARSRLTPDQVAPWIDGYLVAQDRSVADVVDDLRRYYGGLVLLRGATLPARHLTGIYSLSDPVAALELIAASQDAVLTRLSPWIVVISES
ncbi:FecR family protein [Nisaea nitritireducens]|uniref:FecR family protein n=1 Tax=Nisaea nitritireducens TaxID=568392 RepID=UPI001865B4AF|nr:FecR domain-containing protein [Nisaea nitritireducens]